MANQKYCPFLIVIFFSQQTQSWKIGATKETRSNTKKSNILHGGTDKK